MQGTRFANPRGQRQFLLALGALVTMCGVLFGGQTPAASAAANTIGFSAATYTVVEGGVVNLVLARDVHGSTDASVTYTIADGTAQYPAHYSDGSPPGERQILFGAMDLEHTVPVTTLDDPTSISRTFTLTITAVNFGGAPGVIGTNAVATVTITDNDSPAAVVTSVSPASGPTAGGTNVNITGTGFLVGTCAAGVTFGGTLADSCFRNSNFSLSVTTPAKAAGTYAVVVNNGNGPSNADNTFAFTDGPRVTGISPNNGPAGTNVTITGENLKGSSGTLIPTVSFGGINALIVGTPTANQIVATAPALAPGVVRVMVTAGAEVSPDTPADDYTYPGTPVVTSISPTSGGVGSLVTINGASLKGAGGLSTPTVTFGGLAAVVQSSTTVAITVIAPEHIPGLVDVQVTVDGVSSSTAGSGDDFTYVGTPVITSMSPVAGPPGISVTIQGSGFGPSAVVRFGAQTATVSSSSATQLVVIAPANANGPVRVTVTVGGLTSVDTPADDFTYTLSSVAITNVSPNFGPASGGTVVTLTGVGFTQLMTATFGGTPVAITDITPTSAKVVAPLRAGPGTVSIIVNAIGGLSPDTDADNFTYLTIPFISGMDPNFANATLTTFVTITGFNFTGVTSVKFGSVSSANFVVQSDTSIRVATPGSSLVGAVDVTVTNAAGTSAANAASIFTFTGAGGVPTVTSLSPSSTAINTADTVVTVTGTNFAAGATVTFGGVEGTSVQVLSSTQLKVTAPASGTAGAVEVVVTTGTGSNATAGTGNDFTYAGATLPTVTGLSPSSVAINTSGTQVTITGTNFTAGATVTFGGTAATNVVFVSTTTLTATAPSRASAATVDVVVTTTTGSSSTSGSGNDFTYTDGSVTFTYNLFRVYTLITWTGKDNMSVESALKGIESPDNPNTVSVFGRVSAVFSRSTDGTGCNAGVTECWLGFFPNGVGVAGANNLALLRRGLAYWLAVSLNTPWTVVQGP